MSLRVRVYALVYVICGVLTLGACSVGGSDDKEAEADAARVPRDLHPPELIGEWRLVAVDGPARSDIGCPARLFMGSREFSCGDDDTVLLQADGTYEDTLSGFFADGPHEGTWIASTGQEVLVIDDRDDEADPQTYRFSVEGDDLHIERDLTDADDREKKKSVAVDFERVSP